MSVWIVPGSAYSLCLFMARSRCEGTYTCANVRAPSQYLRVWKSRVSCASGKAIRACRLVLKLQAGQVGSARARGPGGPGRAAEGRTGPDSGYLTRIPAVKASNDVLNVGLEATVAERRRRRRRPAFEIWDLRLKKSRQVRCHGDKDIEFG